jgi:hypothetical protein
MARYYAALTAMALLLAVASCGSKKMNSAHNEKLLVQVCNCGENVLALNETMQRLQMEGKQDSLLMEFDRLEAEVQNMETCVDKLMKKHKIANLRDSGLANELKKTCPPVHKALLDNGHL